MVVVIYNNVCGGVKFERHLGHVVFEVLPQFGLGNHGKGATHFLLQ